MQKKLTYIVSILALAFIALLAWRYIEIQQNEARLRLLRESQNQAIIASSTISLPNITPSATSSLYETKIQYKTDVFSYVSVAPNQVLVPGTLVKGEVRGNWYFEGSFPVELRTLANVLLWSGVAQAQSNWMTTNFVPFNVPVNYTPLGTSTPAILVLKKDNPSGEPINDDELQIPVVLQ